MAVPTTLVIDATQETLEISNSRDATALRGYSIEAGPPTDGEGLFFQASSSEYVFRTVDESIDDRVAELLQDSAAGGLTWTYDDSAGTLTPAYVGDSTLVTTGALNSGSITSGFTSIDVGTGAITTTGTVSGGVLAGTLSSAAQTNVTSLGTLTALQVDNININLNTISSTAGTDLNITPLSGQQIVLDGAIIIDAGVVTGATSITSTAFAGDLTGDVTGDVSGTAATVTGATQAAITTAANLTTVGALNAGSISTDFGAINVGSSTITGGGASFTTISGSTSLVLATGATVTGIDNGGVATGSATLLATQGAIKTYVDAQVTAQDLDIISDSGNIDIDLDSESLTLAGGTGLASSASSTTVTFAIDSTVATLAGSQTLTNKTLTTPVISSISNTGTVTLPTSTDTLVGKATTDTLTNKSISGSTNTLSAIANGSLTNSTVAYGGVLLSLGGADSTPAFNLSDATAYTGDSSLVTVGALASGSIASGFTSISTSYTDAKVTSVVAGTLIDVSGATGDVTVNTDLSELSTSTSDGDGDYFAVVDAANAQKKLTKANISIAGFNTAVATSITGVGTLTAGTWTADVISGAYIDATSSPLANTKIWIGSASNVAAEFALSGNATMTAGGVVTVSTAAACSGLAATATALATARAINGVDFDGTAPITVTAAAGTLSGTELKSTVVTSSLTSTGALNGGSITSGFGAIDVGSSNIDGGTITGTFSGNITGNVTGNASGTAATVTGAAQSAITSLGTLTSLGVGAITSTGAFVTSSVGPHAFGGAAGTNMRMSLTGSFSGASGSQPNALRVDGAITGVGDVTYMDHSYFGCSASTPASDPIQRATQVAIFEPNISVGSGGSVGFSASLYIAGAADEASSNYALFVDDGASRFDDEIYVAATKKIYLDGGGNTYINETSTDKIQLVSNGSTSMTLDGSQDVNIPNGGLAIGTTSSPESVLDVIEVTVDTNVASFKYNSDTAIASNAGIKIWNADSSLNSKGGIHFAMSRNTGTEKMSGAIQMGRDESWTTTDSTNDSYMAFGTATNAVVTEKMRIDTTGNVGIGTSSPGRLLELNAGSGEAFFAITNDGTSADHGILFGDDANDAEGQIRYNIATHAMRFHTSGTQAISIDSSQDVTFAGSLFIGGTGSSNELDDYETGAWTPIIGNNVNSNVKAAGSTNVGRYTKIGNLCTVSGTCNWDGGDAITGIPMIMGLPFNTRSQTNGRDGGSAGQLTGITFAGTDELGWGLGTDQAQSGCYIFALKEDGYSNGVVASAGTIYGFTITYQTA